jgi:hypothetical protein
MSGGVRRLAISLLALAAVVLLPVAAAAGRRAVEPIILKSGTLRLKFSRPVYAALTRSSTGADADTRSVFPLAPAASPAAGLFTFRVTGGRLNLADLTGSVHSRGGLAFTNVTQNARFDSTTQFSLRGLALNFALSPAELTATFLGQSRTPNAPIATLSMARARRVLRGRSLAISGVTLKLTRAAAELFNHQAGGFRSGEAIGSVSLSAVR